MKPIGRPAADQESESIEFVPKRDLDRARQEIDRLQQQNQRWQQEAERLKQEAERLRRELEAALRASKRQAAPHSRGQAASRAAATAGRRAIPFRSVWTQGEISERGLSIATGKLESQAGPDAARRRNPANRRLARHLEHERLWLFTFLHCPGLDATNNVAERAIRGMVIARKVWGGNRTWEAHKRTKSWPACCARAGSRARTPSRAA